jgi:5-formyltetrahydrofolate cyclo-ligase
VERADDLSTAGLTAEKTALRRAVRARRRALPAADVRAASAAVVARLASLPAVARARTIALFAARAADGELDPAPLADGRRALFPVVAAAPSEPGGPALLFRAAAPSELVPDRYGIPAPAASAPAVALDDADVVIVPGLAFDRAGRRLGEGAGFYDAALRGAPRPLRVAVAHDFQLVDRVPVGPADEPVDLIVTPAGVVETHARPHVPSGGTP